MYLTSSITGFDGQSYEMVDVISASVSMSRERLSLGYRSVKLKESCMLGDAGTVVRGHEFHHSSLSPQGVLHYTCELSDARNCDCGQDGIRNGNVLALYTHIHFLSEPSIARSLVNAAGGSKVGNEI